jgi:predicted nucleic acid-binding protein
VGTLAAELSASIPPGASLIVDTPVLIAYYGGDEPVSPVARVVLDDLVRTERNEGYASTVSTAELLIAPAREGTAREVSIQLLSHTGLLVRNVDFLVSAEAARIRAQSSLRLPDALILATGVLSSAEWMVTNHRRLASAVPTLVPEMKVCLLSDFV